MRVLLIDADAGNGQLGFAMRAIDQGHEVKWFFRKPIDWNVQPIGKGIVPIVHDWRAHLDWADLVILGDNTKYLVEIDGYRKSRGLKVVGATVESARWELDRTFGQAVFKKAGIEVPPYREFSNYDQAIAYVKKEGREFVSKPCGDEENKALSYVPTSAADLVYMLERWKRQQKHKDSFILQERVKGKEMAVGAWFGPDGFSSLWCENFEEKKLFPGGLGPNTGEMGTALKMVARSKLADKVLKPLESALERTGHVGYVDVNCIIDEKGVPWPLEFTMRFGYPTFPIQQALIAGDVVEWLYDLAEGRDAKPWSREHAVGVVMAIGDFPHSHITKKEVVGVPIYGATPSVLDRLHFCEVMRGTAPHMHGELIANKPCYVTAGDYVLVAAGVGGTSVVEARGHSYQALNRIKLPSSPFWRDDIGQHLRYDLPALQALGYAREWSYAQD